MYITDLSWYINGNLYVKKRYELSNLIIEHLPQEDGEEIMKTIADSSIEESINKGVSQGIAIGIKKIATRMLKEKIDIKLISSVTSLSIDEVLKLKNRL